MSDIKEMLLNSELRDQPALKTEEVEIPGVGILTIRAITRAEGGRTTRPWKGKEPTPTQVEIRTVQCGLVEPQMTVEEVERWASTASFGEIQKVTRAILRLSGMTSDGEEEDPVKVAYKSPE